MRYNVSKINTSVFFIFLLNLNFYKKKAYNSGYNFFCWVASQNYLGKKKDIRLNLDHDRLFMLNFFKQNLRL